MVFCRGCGKEIHESAVTCPHCGAPQKSAVSRSQKSQTAAFLWTIFLGNLGVHRFYLGQVGLGLLYLFTLGFLGIGSLIDAFRFAFMSPKDFADKYNQGVLGAPLGTWAKVLVLAPLVLVVVLVMFLVGGQAHKDYEARKTVASENAASPTDVAATRASNSTSSLEEYRSKAKAMDYRKAMFEEYSRGELFEITGVVNQVVDDQHIAILTRRDDMLGYVEDRVMVKAKGAKVLGNDMVKIYARYDGTLEYQTVLGAQAKAPKVIADYLDVIGRQE